MKPIYSAYLFHSSALVLFATILSQTNSVFAQDSNIVPDSTLGAESSVVNTRDENSNSINGGAIRGSNLFHSFQEFNVGADRGVYFANPDAVNNIFSRVTGNNASNILGTLGVDGAANLYLINPNGIVFGESASLDVQGSFTATTADGIEFSEGGFFSAVQPGESLLTISVPLGLQFGSTPGSIVNQSFTVDETGEFVGLQVPTGENLTLVGGEVRFEAGEATARGGNINIGGLGAAGTVGFNDDASLSFPDDIDRADITFTNAADVDVRGAGGGNINVNADNLIIEAGESDSSQIRAGITADSTSPEAQAGNITLDADNNLTIDNSLVFNELETEAIGNAGDINLLAGLIDITNGALVVAGTDGQGNSGSINIFADESVNIDDESGSTFIANNVFANGQGNSQGINFIVGSLFVNNGAQIQSLTQGEGNSGKIVINARDTVSFDGRDDSDSASAAVSNVEEDARGNAGGIEVIAPSLSLTNRAQFASVTQGTGNGGNISIQVEGEVELGNSQIISDVSAPNENGIEGDGGFGVGGDVTIKANSLLLEDGSFINADTENVGNAGDITIDVNESVILKGKGLGAFPGDTGIFFSQISTTAERNSFGKSGNIDISANELSIDEGFITSSTSSVGDAANINISASNLFLTNGGQILSLTRDSGNAGNIILNVSDTIFLDGVDTNNSPSSLSAGVEENGTGQGGNIIVGTTQFPKQLSLTNGAVISTASSGTSDAGDITLNIIDSLQATNSSISTSSTQSSGGNLTITAGDIQLRGDSDLTTDIALGEGSGGNIAIKADSIIAFDDSDIFAFAADGQGGNITLDTSAFFAENFTLNSLTTDPDELDLNNRADVNATGAVSSGAVSIPDVSFIQNSLTELPNNSLDTDELVANSCVVPVGDRNQGKFIITGGESLPVRPGGNLPSKYPTGEVRGITEDNTSSWQPGDPIIEPQGAYRLANGKMVLSRECL